MRFLGLGFEALKLDFLDDGRDIGEINLLDGGFDNGIHFARESTLARSFALYGDTTGETDEFGLPVRYPWAQDYRGKALVAYGHTPVPEAVWVNNTICLGTPAACSAAASPRCATPNGR